MTKRQRDALRFIRSYIEKNEIGPSYSEICAALGLASKAGAHRLVHGLASQGFLKIGDHGSGKHRNIISASAA